jgi:NAD(P)-dependent dehydrogenase (short-subunit alcohol dehydrogenase family)
MRAHWRRALGMNLVLVDVQQDALDAGRGRNEAPPARQCWPARSMCPSAEQMEALAAAATRSQFGAPAFRLQQRRRRRMAVWCGRTPIARLGMGAGRQPVGRDPWRAPVRSPMMLEAAGARTQRTEGHIVNTASMAGLLTPPNMGIYNVSQGMRSSA